VSVTDRLRKQAVGGGSARPECRRNQVRVDGLALHANGPRQPGHARSDGDGVSTIYVYRLAIAIVIMMVIEY